MTATRWIAVLVGLACTWVLGNHAGGDDLPTTAVSGLAVVALATLAGAITLRRQARLPDCAPIALIFVPAAVIALVQTVPFGWAQPWLTADGIPASAWSLEPQASGQAAAWMLGLAVVATLVAVAARGLGAWTAAQVLVAVVAAHAALGLVLAVLVPDWPSSSAAGRVRGSFVYPNHAAVFWGACLPVALLGAARRGLRWMWFAAGALALAVLGSASRGGIAATTLITLPVVWTLLPQRRRGWYALALGLALAGYLALLGLDLTRTRFSSLVDAHGVSDEGLTVNGRLFMWRAALPLIAEAGPLGSGAGTTRLAFLRAGNPDFAANQVDQLHNDPLQWCLEFGWLGAALLAAGLAWGLWRLRAEGDPGVRLGTVRTGVWCGLGVLAVHCLVDFTWHSPAIALLGALFIGLLVASRQAPDMQLGRRTAGLRTVLVLAALALAAAVWWAWPLAQADEQAVAGSRFLHARLARNDAWDARNPLLATGDGEPRTAESALLRARVLLAADAPGAADLDRAAAALDAAARLAPGHAEVWAERARLAARRGGPDQVSEVLTATRHALAWAPASPYVQATVLWSLTRLPDAAAARAQAEALVRPLLRLDRPQPSWFFPAAARLIGAEELETMLLTAGPHLGAAALPWLARQGGAACWLHQRRAAALLAPPEVAAGQWLAAQELVERPRYVVPSTLDHRMETVLALHRAGLPLPEGLREALRADGPPWASLVQEPFLADAVTRTALADACASALWRPWAREFAARLSALGQVEVGLTTQLGAQDEPWLIATARQRPDLAAAERTRLGLLLAGRDHPVWQEDVPGCRWSWLMVPTEHPAPRALDLPEWTGLAVDGVWRGWWRGRCDLAVIAGPGLHRIAVMPAP